MIGAAKVVAQGLVDKSDVLKILETPKYGNWDRRFSTARARGLSLVDVAYSDESLKLATDDVKKLPLPPLIDLQPASLPEIQWYA